MCFARALSAGSIRSKATPRDALSTMTSSPRRCWARRGAKVKGSDAVRRR
jgi:hypothetical protein